MKKIAKDKGFTLIEILVVIGIIAVLATIVIIAINPARQFAQARNTQRISNLNSILNAVGQNLADNKGVWTCGSVTIGTPAASSTIGTTVGITYADLGSCLVPKYIPSSIPVDPTDGTTLNTKYEISVDSATGRYMLCAQNTEANLGNPEICVSR